MAIDRQKFISELVAAHSARPALPRPGRRAWHWFLGGLVLNALATRLVQPYRPGFPAQVLGHPRYLLEMASAFLIVAAAAYVAFVHAVPGERVPGRIRLAIAGLALVFVVSLLWGLASAAPDFGISGSRPGCWLEGLAYGGVALAGLIALLRRAYPRPSFADSALIGLAAGLMPAAIMHVACMYSPFHALAYHYGPVPLLVIAAMLLGRRVRGVGDR